MRSALKLATVVTAAAMLLASCSSSTDVDGSVVPTLETPPSLEATPTPEVTEEPVPEVAVGDVVTAEQAETLPEGQVAFELETGELVVVDQGQRLPDVILNEVAAKAPESLPPTNPGIGPSADVFYRSQEVGLATGRYPVTVVRGGGYGRDGSLESEGYGVSFQAEAMTVYKQSDRFKNFQVVFRTPEEALAFAEEIVAQTSDPSIYDIIVAVS